MKYKLLFTTLALFTFGANASEMTVKMFNLKTSKPAGTITINASKDGTVFTPNLHGLTPGLHGFHVHTNPSCGTMVKMGKTVVGGAAGGHYDPKKTDHHGAPWGNNNHLGDLPALYVDQKMEATQPVFSSRIKLSDLKGRSLMIHANGDNYSDHPAPLGGGGKRMLCGVIK